ncbi:MAG: efflux RND transporter permease subunit, partial [Terriglobia bacterium]
DQIRNLSLGQADLRLRDVARVSVKQPPLEYGRHLDGEFALGIDIFKEPAANTVDTVDRVMVAIDGIRHDPELHGINLLIWTNQGEEIRKALAGLHNAGVFGGLLAVVVLFAFLRRISTTLIVAVAIPFSLVVTCGVMYLLGSVLNVLTMLGLMVGVGMLVDNAVVVIENIHRHEGMGLPPREAARVGAREVGLAVLAATATTVIVWSWLFTVEPGPLVIYMGAVALTLCLAVVSSLLISLTFIPLAAARFVPHRPVRPGVVQRRVVPFYRAVLSWTLRHRVLALAGLIALAGSAAVPITQIEKTGDVSEQERDVRVVLHVHDPANLEVMEGHINTVESWLAGLQDQIGYENIYSYYDEHSFAVTRVFLPWKRASEATLRRTREILQANLPVIPGVTFDVGDQNRFRHGGGGDRRFVTVALHGEDEEYLREEAVQVEDRLRRLDGVKEMFGPTVHGQQEAQIHVDADRARSLGLSPREVADAVSFTYRGRQLRRFHEHDSELETLLTLPDSLRPGLASLDKLAIPRGDGGLVPLGSVGRVTMARTQQQIERDERRTTQWVTAEFDPSITTDVARDRVQAAMAGVHLPDGYDWDWGQRGQDRDDTLAIMLKGVLLSLVLVVLLMAALFESVLQPAAILITLPLAFSGAFWALWLLGYRLEPVGFMGVIILIGMVVNNGIVMVDHVNRL